mmetsp:Transcript_29402/g.74005  ORF Transcript_29402/g.74005 Transcript_29402/m.74005 type:complete len:260 (+) Transcript_29402:1341-2120(+)
MLPVTSVLGIRGAKHLFGKHGGDPILENATHAPLQEAKILGRAHTELLLDGWVDQIHKHLLVNPVQNQLELVGTKRELSTEGLSSRPGRGEGLITSLHPDCETGTTSVGQGVGKMLIEEVFGRVQRDSAGTTGRSADQHVIPLGGRGSGAVRPDLVETCGIRRTEWRREETMLLAKFARKTTELHSAHKLCRGEKLHKVHEHWPCICLQELKVAPGVAQHAEIAWIHVRYVDLIVICHGEGRFEHVVEPRIEAHLISIW